MKADQAYGMTTMSVAFIVDSESRLPPTEAVAGAASKDLSTIGRLGLSELGQMAAKFPEQAHIDCP